MNHEEDAMPKLTVQLSEKLTAMLEELSKEQEISKTHVIRRALALLKYLEDERGKGGKVLIRDQNGATKELVNT
jgi:Arc/MetJ-type ribon-helix-helix transcriptional regulator